MLDKMNPNELEALAVKLYTQMVAGSNRFDVQSVEVKDVKDWIASHKKETQACSELSFFLNLL